MFFIDLILKYYMTLFYNCYTHISHRVILGYLCLYVEDVADKCVAKCMYFTDLLYDIFVI